jgi:hypothetical protein
MVIQLFHILLESFVKSIFKIEIINNSNIYQYFSELKRVEIMLNQIIKKLKLKNELIYPLEYILSIYGIIQNSNDLQNYQNIFSIIENDIKFYKEKDYQNLISNFKTIITIINKFSNFKNSELFTDSFINFLRKQFIRIDNEDYKLEIERLDSTKNKLLNELIYVDSMVHQIDMNGIDFWVHATDQEFSTIIKQTIQRVDITNLEKGNGGGKYTLKITYTDDQTETYTAYTRGGAKKLWDDAGNIVDVEWRKRVPTRTEREKNVYKCKFLSSSC